LAQGELSISGWVYDIATGNVLITEEELMNFRAIEGQ
jgi:carbonic anhydrase